jgi:hypothetical protein
LRMLEGVSRDELEKRHICLPKSYFHEVGPNENAPLTTILSVAMFSGLKT